ncbi:MAG: hypothetical protein JSU82_12240 [Rhodospirillales bacterium]|nr:MAG: hypothetical protein JSU82_12240 [Rhodospirillales bacterium]
MPQPNRPVLSAALLAVATLAAFLIAQPAAPARADTRAACLQRAAAEDLAGKADFQHGLFRLIVDGKPEFAALAALNRDLQIALAQAQAARFAYLVKNDPDRIETKGTLSEFRNFEWSETDETALRGESESYRALAARIVAQRRRSNGHCDWPQLRAYFAEGLATGPAYRTLIDGVGESDAAVAALIDSCPPD